ncbi:MAG: ABC transporter ATP-binding protein [Lachnospiraceae bacterium]|nr:ABC transporter ATP-binding protein [Lachnospiraceae bacterium]
MELRMEHLKKQFQDTVAVADVTYTLHSGVYGLLGANGAGKTTLMRMICTLLQPTQGRITFGGKDIFEMGGTYRRILGYLPQNFGYYPDFTVQDYLMYIASIKGIRPAVAKKRVKELLAQVGMEEMKGRKMKRCSGGMRRRVGIAQAMLNDPAILVLDEPTAGLDPNERIRFRNLIAELAADRLVLLSTHIVSDVEYIANEILLMQDGKIAHSGTVSELADAVTERAWSCLVPQSMVASMERQYQISNMKTVQGGVELRILSGEQPCSSAVLEPLTLEDIFLCYTQTRPEDKEAAEGGRRHGKV